MRFSEKLKKARLAVNMSQTELSELTGISERSIYSYEQGISAPRSSNVRKLANALNVSSGYLLDEEETDATKKTEQEDFFLDVHNKFGNKAVKEATDVLQRVSVLFAGGDLDPETKDIFFRSLMEVYLKSKEEAQIKFAPRQRAGKKRKS